MATVEDVLEVLVAYGLELDRKKEHQAIRWKDGPLRDVYGSTRLGKVITGPTARLLFTFVGTQHGRETKAIKRIGHFIQAVGFDPLEEKTTSGTDTFNRMFIGTKIQPNQTAGQWKVLIGSVMAYVREVG